LGGIFQTRDRGTIWFAILNRGAGDIDIFHRVQDQVVLALTQKWGQLQNVEQGLASFPSLPNFKPVPWQDSDRNEIVLPSIELNPK
jgi:D-alanyl-D-alanine carboxypeptidase/D-alanyl-D-alanine-endopeptidase (penicillin-binding protein 4)